MMNERTKDGGDSQNPSWGAGAYIVRRPETGDKILAQLNFLDNLGQAALISQIVDQLAEPAISEANPTSQPEA